MSIINTISDIIPPVPPPLMRGNESELRIKNKNRSFILFNNALFEDLKTHYIIKMKINYYNNVIKKSMEQTLNNDCIDNILSYMTYDNLYSVPSASNQLPIQLDMIFYLLFNKYYLETDDNVEKLAYNVKYKEVSCTVYPDSIRKKFTKIKMLTYAVNLINDNIKDELKQDPLILFINDYITLLN